MCYTVLQVFVFTVCVIVILLSPCNMLCAVTLVLSAGRVQCAVQLVFVMLMLDDRMTGHNYLDFLQNELPQQLGDVPLATRIAMYCQHDGAPSNYT